MTCNPADHACLESHMGSVCCLQRYLSLQHALAASLRTGLLNLSAGRYSMGADRVSSLQFPAHMQATSRIAVTGVLVRLFPGRLTLQQPQAVGACSCCMLGSTEDKSW